MYQETRYIPLAATNWTFEINQGWLLRGSAFYNYLLIT
jgi:hypothetical protein